MKTLKLTKAMVPNQSSLLWVSDVHIGIEHRPALELMVEFAEREGITHNVPGGDIYDCHSVSKHAKDVDRMRAQSALLDEAHSGEWFAKWLSTRPTYMIVGNHEDRINRFVADNPALYGMTVKSALHLPDDWTIIDNGGSIRLGNLVLAHGNSEFQRGSGGRYPAQKLLDMAPDQSTMIGHLHRISSARRTSLDEEGIPRTRAAWTMPHMSIEERHHEYAGRHPNWQMGFGKINVWWEGDRPRWSVYQIEVLFDRRNRPYFEFNGRLYK